MTLFWDTETTGMALFKQAADHPDQPRIVQLGAILCAEDRRVVSEINMLVKPDGWTIPAEATAIHGITTAMCEQYGYKIATVLRCFSFLVMRAKRHVAHNHPFDELVTRSEMLRAKLESDVVAFLACEGHCTMAQATPIMKLPGRFGDFKWPNLKEAHQHFLGRPLEGAHDAMNDVRGCRDIYWAMNPLPAPTMEVG